MPYPNGVKVRSALDMQPYLPATSGRTLSARLDWLADHKRTPAAIERGGACSRGQASAAKRVAAVFPALPVTIWASAKTPIVSCQGRAGPSDFAAESSHWLRKRQYSQSSKQPCSYDSLPLACRPTQEVEHEPDTDPAPEPALEPPSQEQDARDLLRSDTELRRAVQRSQLLADVLLKSEAEQQRQVDQYADQLLKQEYQ